jgi:hypothetical protein
MSFPNNYLPSNSQAWGREVQKRIENTETAVARNERNNDARDTQLASAFDRLNATVLKSQEALNKVITVEEQVYFPGTTEINGANIRANTIAANKISAGTLTGFTVQTADSGTRVLMGGPDKSNIQFFDSTGTITGSVYADTSNFNIGNVRSGNGTWGTGSRSYINLGLGTATFGVNDGSFSANLTMTPLGSSFENAVSAPGLSAGIQGLSTSNGLISTSGAVEIRNPGGAMGSNYLQVPDTYVRTVASGRIVYVSSAGTYNCSTSSARYKQDITPYEVDIDKLLMLEPVSFRYKQAVEEHGENADVAHGFIAEQADAIGLTEFVDYEPDEDGNLRPDNFRYIDFTAALLGAVKKQQMAINDLSSRLAALEDKV